MLEPCFYFLAIVIGHEHGSLMAWLGIQEDSDTQKALLDPMPLKDTWVLWEQVGAADQEASLGSPT